MYISNTAYTFPISIQSSTGNVTVQSISGALYLDGVLNNTAISVLSISGVVGSYFVSLIMPLVTTKTSFSIRVTTSVNGTVFNYFPLYGELVAGPGLVRSNSFLEYRASSDPF